MGRPVHTGGESHAGLLWGPREAERAGVASQGGHIERVMFVSHCATVSAVRLRLTPHALPLGAGALTQFTVFAFVSIHTGAGVGPQAVLTRAVILAGAALTLVAICEDMKPPGSFRHHRHG